LFANDVIDADCEIVKDKGEEEDYQAPREMIVGKILTGEVHDGDESTVEPKQEVQEQDEQQGIPNEARWPKPNEEHDLQVYKHRRQNEEQHQMQGRRIRLSSAKGNDLEAQK
jgi:hypothetical protein